MFDRWSYFGDKRRRLMEQSWAGVFRNHLLVELPVDDLCRHLDERTHGPQLSPSKDLHVVIGVLLLQQLHDLSDAETVEALAFNMAWHYALDVRSEADSYFCEKTLRNYRRLFIVIGVLLLQQLHDLSDAETVEALAFNMAWQGLVCFATSKRAIEPLGDAVGRARRRRRLDAPRWLVKCRQILGAVIHPQGQPPSRAGRGEPYSPASPMAAEVPLQTCQPNSAFQCSTAMNCCSGV